MSFIVVDNLDYFVKQFQNPYESTKAFCTFLKKNNLLSDNSDELVVDIGCGMGETLYYFANQFPYAKFIGVDLNADLVKKGKLIFHNEKITNVSLTENNLFFLTPELIRGHSGLISLATLSWMDQWKEALSKMCSLDSEWIAFSSLFFDGSINCEIKIQDYEAPSDSKPYTEYSYNIYSIPLIKKLLKENGYELINFEPFEIEKDISKPTHGRMGTYTVQTEHKKRLQLSGPLLMSWYFLAAKKIV